MSGFADSNKQGSKFEKKAVELLINNGFPEAKIDHDNKRFDGWDIRANAKSTIECKDDKLSRYQYPYNICIEMGQYDRDYDFPIPSGIVTTQSTHWLHSDGIEFDGTTFYLARSKTIKFYIDSYMEYYENLEKISKKIAEPQYDGTDATKMMSNFKSESEEKYGVFFKYIIAVDRELKPEIKTHTWVKQGKDEPGKYMDLFIIKKVVFKKLCLEYGVINDITFEDLV